MPWSYANIDWVITSTVCAAWVQAVGSVAAIAAAIWISRDSLQKAESRELQRQTQAAALIASDIVDLIGSAAISERSAKLAGGGAAILATSLRRRTEMLEALPPTHYANPGVLDNVFRLISLAGAVAVIVDEHARIDPFAQRAGSTTFDEFHAEGERILSAIRRSAGFPAVQLTTARGASII